MSPQVEGNQSGSTLQLRFRFIGNHLSNPDKVVSLTKNCPPKLTFLIQTVMIDRASLNIGADAVVMIAHLRQPCLAAHIDD